MSASGSLQIAARALRVNKLRSALTVLGIVVGVAAVVCMVSVGAGAQAEVSEKIRTLGGNLLLVMPGARDSGGARLESGTQVTLTEEDAAAIRGEVVDAQVVAPLLSRSMPLVAGNRNWMTRVAGINTDYLVAREWQMVSGRSFTSAEMGSAAKVAIVGAVIVEALFEGRAGIGETFRIGNVPFTVIGVLDKKGLGAAGHSQDDIVFIPLSTAKSRVLGAVRGTTREALDFISIKVSDADAMPTVTDDVEKLLRQRHRIRGDTPDDFRIDEHAVLAKELSSRMTPCEGWGGYTVDQLVRAALSYRADCSEQDDELLTILQRERPSELPLWLMLRLVGICRHVAGLSVPYTDLETATRTAAREELLN
jgi:putative ABC transport system permease protein